MWNNDKNSQENIMDKINSFFYSFQKIKPTEKVVFYRLLSTMINSWVWIIRAIKVLEEQEENPVFKKVLKAFWVELKSWKKLSECLGMYPASFSIAEIWVIESWEKTGRLNLVLDDLAEQTEKLVSVTWKIKAAMIYPSTVIAVVIWVVFIMMSVVVPRLLEIFDDPSKLPESTQLLMKISYVFENYWYLLIMWMVLFIIWILIWKKTPNWKYNFDMFMIKMPIFGEIMKKIILSKFSRILSGLLGSWVSIIESLRITSDAVWNEVYRQRILLLMEDVKKWMKIWESIDWDPLFPAIMIQMIQVWEQTAKLDSIILKIADFYDEQVDIKIWVINKLLEPIIIVVLALIVWFIAISIMEPIMQLADQASSK